MKRVSERTIGRLARYRAWLLTLPAAAGSHVFSHQIAAAMGLADSQVRRDLMVVASRGVPRHGYSIQDLLARLDDALCLGRPYHVAVAGVGNLGRALTAFLASADGTLCMKAAFDADPAKCGQLVAGVPCHPMEAVAEVVAREGITLAVLCVPAAGAQEVAERLVAAGVRGLLNFAPVALHLPAEIAVEDLDLTATLEKVAYFTTHPAVPSLGH